MVGSTTLHAAGARAPRDTPSSSKRRVGKLDLQEILVSQKVYQAFVNEKASLLDFSNEIS